MNVDLEKYFIKDPDTPRFRREINMEIRKQKALDQITIQPVAISQVFSYVNEFLELVKLDGGIKGKTNQIRQIELDNSKHIIIDNGIIAVNCQWTDCEYDKETRRYTYHDSKYDNIQKEFGLRYPNNIIWLKFTTDGYVGVVARSFDINFDYGNTAGKLVRDVKKKWDESFVIIFPLTEHILIKRNKGDIETGVGNYLKEHGVPIIDFFSHNY